MLLRLLISNIYEKKIKLKHKNARSVKRVIASSKHNPYKMDSTVSENEINDTDEIWKRTQKKLKTISYFVQIVLYIAQTAGLIGAHPRPGRPATCPLYTGASMTMRASLRLVIQPLSQEGYENS